MRVREDVGPLRARSPLVGPCGRIVGPPGLAPPDSLFGLCRDSGPLKGFTTTYKTAGTAKGRLSRSTIVQDGARCGLGCGLTTSRDPILLYFRALAAIAIVGEKPRAVGDPVEEWSPVSEKIRDGSWKCKKYAKK